MSEDKEKQSGPSMEDMHELARNAISSLGYLDDSTEKVLNQKNEKEEPKKPEDEDAAKAEGEAVDQKEEESVERKDEEHPDTTQAKEADSEQEQQAKEEPGDADKDDKGKGAEKDKSADDQNQIDTRTTAEIAREFARELAKEFGQKNKQEEPQESEHEQKQDDALSRLPQEVKEDVSVFNEMEAMDKNYNGLAGKYVDAYHKIEQYKNNWEKEYPGEQFDVNDPEHEEQIAKILPRYNSKDYDKARIKLEVRNELQRENVERQGKERTERAAKQVDETINNELPAATSAMASFINEKYGEKPLDEESLNKLGEEDKLSALVIRRQMPHLKNHIAEFEKLTNLDLDYEFNQSNPIHIELNNMVQDAETRMNSLPENKRASNGKQWIPVDQYNSLPENQRSYYWCFTPQHYKGMIATKFGNTAKQEIEAINAHITSMNAQDKAASKSPQSEIPAGQQPAANRKPKPNPPSTATDSDKINDTNKPKNEFVKTVVDQLFS